MLFYSVFFSGKCEIYYLDMCEGLWYIKLMVRFQELQVKILVPLQLKNHYCNHTQIITYLLE